MQAAHAQPRPGQRLRDAVERQRLQQLAQPRPAVQAEILQLRLPQQGRGRRVGGPVPLDPQPAVLHVARGAGEPQQPPQIRHPHRQLPPAAGTRRDGGGEGLLSAEAAGGLQLPQHALRVVPDAGLDPLEGAIRGQHLPQRDIRVEARQGAAFRRPRLLRRSAEEIRIGAAQVQHRAARHDPPEPVRPLGETQLAGHARGAGAPFRQGQPGDPGTGGKFGPAAQQQVRRLDAQAVDAAQRPVPQAHRHLRPRRRAGDLAPVERRQGKPRLGQVRPGLHPGVGAAVLLEAGADGGLSADPVAQDVQPRATQRRQLRRPFDLSLHHQLSRRAVTEIHLHPHPRRAQRAEIGGAVEAHPRLGQIQRGPALAEGLVEQQVRQCRIRHLRLHRHGDALRRQVGQQREGEMHRGIRLSARARQVDRHGLQQVQARMVHHPEHVVQRAGDTPRDLRLLLADIEVVEPDPHVLGGERRALLPPALPFDQDLRRGQETYRAAHMLHGRDGAQPVHRRILHRQQAGHRFQLRRAAIRRQQPAELPVPVARRAGGQVLHDPGTPARRHRGGPVERQVRQEGPVHPQAEAPAPALGAAQRLALRRGDRRGAARPGAFGQGQAEPLQRRAVRTGLHRRLDAAEADARAVRLRHLPAAQAQVQPGAGHVPLQQVQAGKAQGDPAFRTGCRGRGSGRGRSGATTGPRALVRRPVPRRTGTRRTRSGPAGGRARGRARGRGCRRAEGQPLPGRGTHGHAPQRHLGLPRGSPAWVRLPEAGREPQRRQRGGGPSRLRGAGGRGRSGQGVAHLHRSQAGHLQAPLAQPDLHMSPGTALRVHAVEPQGQARRIRPAADHRAAAIRQGQGAATRPHVELPANPVAAVAEPCLQRDQRVQPGQRRQHRQFRRDLGRPHGGQGDAQFQRGGRRPDMAREAQAALGGPDPQAATAPEAHVLAFRAAGAVAAQKQVAALHHRAQDAVMVAHLQPRRVHPHLVQRRQPVARAAPAQQVLQRVLVRQGPRRPARAIPGRRAASIPPVARPGQVRQPVRSHLQHQQRPVHRQRLGHIGAPEQQVPRRELRRDLRQVQPRLAGGIRQLQPVEPQRQGGRPGRIGRGQPAQGGGADPQVHPVTRGQLLQRRGQHRHGQRPRLQPPEQRAGHQPRRRRQRHRRMGQRHQRRQEPPPEQPPQGAAHPAPRAGAGHLRPRRGVGRIARRNRGDLTVPPRHGTKGR